MRYLVSSFGGFPPFFTNVFDYENNWYHGYQMTVYDLSNSTYTTDGKTWNPIEQDHL